MSIDKRSILAPVWSVLFCIGVSGCQPGTPKQTIESEISGLASKVDYLNLRLNKVEKSIENLQRTIDENEKNARQSRADVSVSMEDLRTEVKGVSGSLGVLRHDLDQSVQTNQKVAADFDTRVTDLDQKLSDLQQQTVRSEPSTKNVDDITRYNQILHVFKTGKNRDQSIAQFREFITDRPKSRLAANAQYWIGEGYFAKKDYAKAITEFQVVVDKYPQGEKVCDALLKQGMAFIELKEPAKAKLFFTDVQERCPKTPVAQKASVRSAKLAAPEPKK